jgi:alcohol dehydrogenase class IV
MSRASMEAGLAFSNAILGAVHAMAHAVGGLSDSPHGECNAILLPEVVRANFSAASDKYRVAARVIGLHGIRGDESDGDRIADGLRDLTSTLPLTKRLSQFGIDSGQIAVLVDLALADPCMLTNPRALGRDEIGSIYERCL